MAASSLLLRLPRADVAGDFVLVNVLRSAGPSPLDVTVVATDGLDPFVAQVHQKAIHKLQTSESQIPGPEWEHILSAVLLQSLSADPVCVGLEAVASVAESQLTITIRKKISGITQRLGAIVLDKDEEQDIQLFDWAASAVSRADGLADRLASLQASFTNQKTKIAELTAHLDDLVKAKKSHEDELLKKFAALLNTKKLKIRDQQRLLAHAKIDPGAGTQIQRARAAAASRPPQSSRTGKRKAYAHISDPESEDQDLEDDARQDDVDVVTPERSEPETDDEDSDGSGFAPAPPQSQAPRSETGANGTRKALEAVRQETSKAIQKEMESQPPAPPPRRQLPFSKRKDGPIAPSEAKPALIAATPGPSTIADEDDETDDEL